MTYQNALLALCVTLLIYYFMRSSDSPSSENFTRTKKHFGKSVELTDGVYSIKNIDGIDLRSDIIDPVMCNDFLIGQAITTPGLNWKLKRVGPTSVYILYKEGEKECLYTHLGDEVRSYSFPASCSSKNLCGLETPSDYKGELDSSSMRTYFMLLQSPEASNKFYIKSMKTGKFLEMTKDKLRLSDTPAIFTINKLLK